MALSKTYVRPYRPNDMSTVQREKVAADGSGFTPGTLVVEVSGLLVECDTDTAVHKTLPAYLVWTDGSTRQDISTYESDGTQVEMYTVLGGNIRADLAASLFTATPVAGDTLVRSATAGKIDPLDAAELADLLNEAETTGLASNVTQIIGVCEGASHFGNSGFYNCSLNLG